MKNLVFIIVLSFAPMCLLAQIDIVAPSGDVGVGTETPLGKLHVDGGDFLLENGRMGFGVTSPARPFHMRAYNSVFRVDRDRNSPGFILARFPYEDYSGNALESFSLIVNGYENGDPGYLALTDFNGAVGGASQRVFLVSSSGSLIIDDASAQDPNAVVESDFRLHVEGAAFKSDGGSEWNVLSDKKLKRNIKSYDNGLDLISKLKPVTYEYNGKAGTIDGQKQIGVVAQELQQVAPHMVSTFSFTTADDGGIEYIDGRPNGEKVNRTEHEYLSINTSALKWALVNAIQDQQEIIETQDEKIASMEKELSDIKNLLQNIGANTDVSSASQTVELSNSSELFQNQPNPFTATTRIKYTLSDKVQSATMKITDINGKLLKTIQLDKVRNGEVIIKAQELNAGTYFYTLMTDGQVLSTKKMILTK